MIYSDLIYLNVWSAIFISLIPQEKKNYSLLLHLKAIGDFCNIFVKGNRRFVLSRGGNTYPVAMVTFIVFVRISSIKSRRGVKDNVETGHVFGKVC